MNWNGILACQQREIAQSVPCCLIITVLCLVLPLSSSLLTERGFAEARYAAMDTCSAH